jgi:anti-sigma regulatory factor (Ser/Thr protein kinase)
MVQRAFARSFDQLDALVAFTRDFFQREGLDPDLRQVVDLCLEELFVNMVTYNTETSADIVIELAAHAGGVEVSLTDFDVDRFDPRQPPPSDLNAGLEERTPGGLGLYLVMKMASSIRYEHRDRTSRITFVAGREEQDANV